MKTDYMVQLEIRDKDSSELLARTPIEANFSPVLDCNYLDRARRTSEDSLVLDHGDDVVEPIWHRDLGEPFIQGFQAQLHNGEKTDVSLDVLATATRPAVARLIEQRKIAKDQAVLMRFTAQHKTTQPASTSFGSGSGSGFGFGFEVEEASPPIPLQRGQLLNRVRISETYDDEHSEGQNDFPVFIDRSVIEQACDLTTAAGAVETGGILIGRLRRDSAPELYLDVTALIPARKAEGQLTRLQFTPECWTDVDAALRLRNQSEIMVGWFHSHPARHWCAECPVEKQRECKVSGEFFSHHDEALHETVFPRAFNVALVISDSLADGLTWPLFGWRSGLVERRGYSIVEANTAPLPSDGAHMTNGVN